MTVESDIALLSTAVQELQANFNSLTESYKLLLLKLRQASSKAMFEKVLEDAESQELDRLF